MKRFVLDASVALSWYVDDPVPTYAVRVRRGLESDLRAIVPPLWILEMANGLSMAEHTGKLTVDDAAAGIHQLEMLMNSVIQVETETNSLREAFVGSRTYRLTAYDAAYLELARRSGLPLATLDNKLRAAAEHAGVAVLV